MFKRLLMVVFVSAVFSSLAFSQKFEYRINDQIPPRVKSTLESQFVRKCGDLTKDFVIRVELTSVVEDARDREILDNYYFFTVRIEDPLTKKEQGHVFVNIGEYSISNPLVVNPELIALRVSEGKFCHPNVADKIQLEVKEAVCDAMEWGMEAPEEVDNDIYLCSSNYERSHCMGGQFTMSGANEVDIHWGSSCDCTVKLRFDDSKHKISGEVVGCL